MLGTLWLRLTSRTWGWFLLGLVAFVPFLGTSHLLDWDEINFAEIAREMLLTGDFFKVQIDFLPFWEKPPFFMWLQALAMHLFGVSEFSARLPNALCGALTLALLFQVGTRTRDRDFGRFWALCMGGSILPHFYFKSGIIDPWFNFWIYASLLSWFFFLKSFLKAALFTSRQRWTFWSLSALTAALAVLTKGPVALLMIGLTLGPTLLIVRPNFWKKLISPILLWLPLVALAFSFWFLFDWIQNGPDMTYKFLLYQIRLLTTGDAGHSGPWWYHFPVLLLGCFPASVFALGALAKKQNLPNQDSGSWWLGILNLSLLISVLVVFSIVKTKIIHYSSLAFFPITYFAADFLYQHRQQLFPGWIRKSLFCLGLVPILFALGTFAIGHYAKALLPYITNPHWQEHLQATVDWPWMLVGWQMALAFSFGLVTKKIKSSNINIFFVTALWTEVFLVFFLPRIEGYTQRPIIEYYQQQVDRPGVITVEGFKSYAHLFYTRKKPPSLPSQSELLNSSYDPSKPIRVVTRSKDQVGFLQAHPHFSVVEKLPGFTVFQLRP